MDPLTLAGLREPYLVEVAGGFYTVEVHPLTTWVAAQTEPLPLLAVLSMPEARELNARTYDRDDDIDVPDLEQGWHDALTAATGMDWWVAERLLAALIGDFAELAGRLHLKGVDALSSPLDVSLHALLAMAVEGASEKERRKFLGDLYKPPMPPAGASKRSTKVAPPGFSPEEQGAAFVAAKRAATPGVRS